ncbi:hypothetical protein [Georgenia subflava]|uniref:hypothetical protein n=1 Tax=Georgenia subflava TaxID=1622177 RepID=UPI00186ADDF6|nr:hypothetical protein [Georgenia subflava]
MPTTRRRHQITETSAVERAIETALRRWPGESRSRALLRLIEIGSAHLDRELQVEQTGRKEALKAIAEEYDGLVSREQLAELRQDWPA